MNRLLAALSISVRLKKRHAVHPNNKSTWLGVLLGCLGIWLVPIPGTSNSAVAAERIYISYGALERSISVAALEAYAKEGKVDDDLATYADYVSPHQLAQLQSVLLAQIELSPVAVSQFLYTPQGEILLERLGQVIQTEARQPGFYALRAALILAAADPEGLTLLNVLDKFPTRSIRINLRRSLQIAEELQRLINQTRQVLALIEQQSTAGANPQQVASFSQLPDLRQPGEFRWRKQTYTLNDLRRNRTFLADIYLPQQQSGEGREARGDELSSSRHSPSFPVIVISHGLGSDRTSFEYLAEQLASYGFAVAVPEHPGSNAAQLRSLLSGRASEVAAPNEFINRPLDVKFLLDQLQLLDSSNPTFKLNLQQVGVIGQSFGGYTALALAGAELNFDQLEKDCVTLNDSWNVSLLLQCRALQLPPNQYDLRDERIKAAIAINPITSSLFGKAGISEIQIPVMIVGSSADTFAPILSEQLLPFSWLFTPEKYLALIRGGTHFSTIGQSDPAKEPVAIPAQVIGPNPAIARRYMDALSVAFFQTYLAKAPQYRPYLSSSYAQAISQDPLNLSLLQSLPLTQLPQFLP